MQSGSNINISLRSRSFEKLITTGNLNSWDKEEKKSYKKSNWHQHEIVFDFTIDTIFSCF